jgi:hypothetical protein
MAIQDQHINLNGFLEGSPQVPLKWTTINLESEPNENEWESIEYFKIRAREFILNVEDLGLPSMWSLGSDSGGEKTKAQTNTFPGRHRAKSIYLDFRHFTADKEPSKFEKVVNVLRRHIDSLNPIQKFLEKLRREFIGHNEHEIEVNGQHLSNQRLIKILFNTEYFHAGNETQRADREILSNTIENEGIQHLLFWSIMRNVHTIKSLYACLKDMEKSRSTIVNCPDVKIINH